MPRALAIVATLLAACGGTAPGPAVAPALPPAAKPTCQDIGVILRGPLDNEAKGPDLERAIATTCAQGRWATQIVDCVASTPDPDHCLGRLSIEQQQAYQLARGDTGTVSAQAEPPAPPAPVECPDALMNVAELAPTITVAPGPQRDWAIAMRTAVLVDTCERTPWSQESRACFLAAHDPNALAHCRSELEAAQAPGLDRQLAASDAVVAKALVLVHMTPPVTCAAVTAHYYADAEWVGQLRDSTAAQRKKVIADTRAKMTKACVQEKWNDLERACLVAGGSFTCFAIAGSDTGWGFPPE